MSALRLDLEEYSYQGKTPGILVEEWEDRRVTLTIEGETDDDLKVERNLSSYEARALAAALLHYAAECERPR